MNFCIYIHEEYQFAFPPPFLPCKVLVSWFSGLATRSWEYISVKVAIEKEH